MEMHLLRQGAPRMPAKHLKSGRGKDRFLRDQGHATTFILNLRPSRMVRQQTSIIFCYLNESVVLCYCSPSKRMQGMLPRKRTPEQADVKTRDHSAQPLCCQSLSIWNEPIILSDTVSLCKWSSRGLDRRWLFPECHSHLKSSAKCLFSVSSSLIQH